MFPIARNLFLYLTGSLLINQIRMKTTLRIFRILFKLLLLSYVAVVNIILISAFYVLLLLIVEWVAPSFLPGLFAEYSFAHHLVCSLPFYMVLLYILYSLSPLNVWLMRMKEGYRPLGGEERVRLERLLSEMGMKRKLNIYRNRDARTNAVTFGFNTIGLTDGILRVATDEELKGVISHEVGHISHYDFVYQVLLFSMQSLGYRCLYGLFLIPALFFGLAGNLVITVVPAVRFAVVGMARLWWSLYKLLHHTIYGISRIADVNINKYAEYRCDNLPKPVQTEKVLGIIRKALECKKKDGNAKQRFYASKSPLALRLQEHIRLVAPVDTLSVLIRGASGTGKEYVARQVHALSGRADAPFIAVDCGVLPKELAASELFGHVKGSFTGASENRTGMFAAANHGTLFLDEVGNLNAEVQRSLLRALQEKCYRPVGGREEMQTDIRLVAATNENLEKAIAEGRFREDLFHRLNEFPLHVPLLAECIEDIIPLAEFMLDAANRELGRSVKGFDREVRKRLKAYSWPGNIRELRMVVRRATLLAKDDWITSAELDLSDKGGQPGEYSLNDERTERTIILKALEATGNDRKAAARLLGISRSTLYLKLKKYRLD